MNEATMRGMRMMAETVAPSGRYQIVLDGRVVAFDLRREQADDWLEFFPGASIYPMDTPEN